MHYAIIAAGDGSRLVSEGVAQPKPLVRINGVPMIERLMRIFAENNAESISVIVNSGMTEVQTFLKEWSSEENLRKLGIGRFKLVVESTPSSMHSFYRLSKVIDADYVCLTTVDTIFTGELFAEFINHVDRKDGLFAVTPYIDDEKPLYVDVSDDSRIIGFHDQGNYGLVSGGIYCLSTKKAFPILKSCIENGVSRMRNYQRALLEAGLDIEAYVFPKIMDVDHARDVELAEKFVEESSQEEVHCLKKILFISRAREFSPNNVEKDNRILELTKKYFEINTCRNVLMSTNEEKFAQIRNLEEYSVVVGMQRRLQSLLKIKNSSIRSFNSAQGIINTATSRDLTLSLLEKANVPVPRFYAFDDEDAMFQCEPSLQKLLPAWIKVMRHNGARDGDVVFVETPIEADSVVLRFLSESVQDIVATSHVPGDLVKVYVVTDSKGEIKFLRWFYPQETGYTKFGEEIHNEPLHHYSFDEGSMREMVRTISKVLELQFFGVDMIVGSDGEMTVIDVNDWPSYSICQDEAADAIARTILVDIETC